MVVTTILRRHQNLKIFNPLYSFQISKMSLSVGPPEVLKTPMSIPEKTLLGPGPSNVPDRVLKAMALPTIGHLHPEFTKVIKIKDLTSNSILTVLKSLQVMDDVKAGIQYIFQTKNKMSIALSSTGHAGMECVMSNLIEKDDVVLIANHGIWGERAKDMARRQGKRTIKVNLDLFASTCQVKGVTKKYIRKSSSNVQKVSL